MGEEENIDLPLYPISSAAKILDISVHTLRMYEREGLIVPYKKESSHRLYSRSDILRLQCIRRAINERKISIAGIKTIYSLIPCWEIMNCSEKDKRNCHAFTNDSEPCWNHKHFHNACAGKDCRGCSVYRDYSDCGSIKKAITSISKGKTI